MASGNLSNDLSLGILTPTPSVRPAESHSPQQDAEAKSRRRPRRESSDSDDNTLEGSDQHQIDDLA